MNQKKFISFRFYLQELLLQRCQKNASYSLRAFARDLDLHPTTLSQILSGRRNVTAVAYKKISKKLKIPPAQAEWFELQLKKKKQTKPVQGREDVLSINAEDGLELVKWYHQTLVEALKLKDYRPSVRWLSQKLLLPEETVQSALDRLLKFGIIKVNEEGSWVPVEVNTNILPAIPVDAVREEVKSNLMKARDAMDNVAFGKKFAGSVIFSLDSNRLKDLFREFEKARIKAVEAMDEGGPYDEIYCLTTAIFPIV